MFYMLMQICMYTHNYMCSLYLLIAGDKDKGGKDKGDKDLCIYWPTYNGATSVYKHIAI